MSARDRFEPWAYSALRAVAGFMFLFHGAQKLFGVLGSHGVPAVGSEHRTPGNRLEALDGLALDPTFVESDAYDLQIFPSVLTTRPRELVPPDADIEEQEIQFAFAVWTQRRPSDSISFIGARSVLDGNVKRMWQDIFPDRHTLGSATG